MNPLALLNPKAHRAKQKKTGSAAQHGVIRPPKPEKHDPLSLLSPKSQRFAKRDDTPKEETEELVGSAVSMSSLMENLHRVQSREDIPRKRRKIESGDEEDDSKKPTFNGIASNGVIGEFFKEKREEAKANGTILADSGPVVDLTNDDDDEIQIVSENVVQKPVGDNREVCLGRIEALGHLDLIPTPKIGPSSLKATAGSWAPMKVHLLRERSMALMIKVQDPTLRIVGNLDYRTSKALAPLLDNPNVYALRTRARLDSRKKIAGEVAGSPTNLNLKVPILLYAPAKNVDTIGRALSQHTVILKDPTENIGTGIELMNPHAPKERPRYLPWAASSNVTYTQTGYIVRTAEEAASDVMNMFDTLIKKSEDLAEKEQDSRVLTPLLQHQRQALHFLTEREKDTGIPTLDGGVGDESFSLWKKKLGRNSQTVYYNVITGQESTSRPPPVLGGILADLMGLGKTLSILSLVVATLDDAKKFATLQPPRTSELPLALNSKATLLIAPLTVVANWEEQLKQHIKPGTLRWYVFHGSNRVTDYRELAKNDIVITSYQTLASEVRNNGTKKPVALTHWFRVVLDEAHMIRNQGTSVHTAACAIAAQRRWAVTATPVQNRLDDLGALIKFLRIKPFDDKGAFASFILTPFRNADTNVLPKFRLLLDTITLRRTKDRIDLPERIDQVVKLNFSEIERPVYEHIINDSHRKIKAATSGSKLGGKGYAHVLKSIMRIRLICAHGESLLSEEDMKLLQGITPGTAIDISEEDLEDKPVLSQKQAFEMLYLLRESDMDRCSSCQKKIGERDTDDEDYEVKANTNTIGHMTVCYHILCPDCLPKYQENAAQRVDETNWMSCPLCENTVRLGFFEMKKSELEEDEQAKARVRSNPKLAKQLGYYRGPHTKTLALIEGLRASETWSNSNPDEAPEKSVIFSGWTSHLDLIQIALEANNFKYVRLDGTMGRKARAASLESFRSDDSITIILVSIGAGGLGLNLTSASKVYMMEPQFNPQAEAQACDRVHRMGQKRVVTISRFIMRDSFEEKILDLQRKKNALADLSLNRKMDKKEAAAQKMAELRDLFK